MAANIKAPKQYCQKYFRAVGEILFVVDEANLEVLQKLLKVFDLHFNIDKIEIGDIVVFDDAEEEVSMKVFNENLQPKNFKGNTLGNSYLIDMDKKEISLNFLDTSTTYEYRQITTNEEIDLLPFLRSYFSIKNAKIGWYLVYNKNILEACCSPEDFAKDFLVVEGKKERQRVRSEAKKANR
jgi:hypothetical protein